MSREDFIRKQGLAMFAAFNDYCETGIDKPTWQEWVDQIGKVERPKLKRVSVAVMVALS